MEPLVLLYRIIIIVIVANWCIAVCNTVVDMVCHNYTRMDDFSTAYLFYSSVILFVLSIISLIIVLCI